MLPLWNSGLIYWFFMFKITICLITDAKEFFTFFSSGWGKQIILPYIKMSWHPLKVFQLLINRSWTFNQGTTAAAISYHGYQYLKIYCCIPTRKYLNGKSATEEMLSALTCPPLLSVRNWYCTLWSANAVWGTPVMVTAVCSSVPTASPATHTPPRLRPRTLNKRRAV